MQQSATETGSGNKSRHTESLKSPLKAKAKFTSNAPLGFCLFDVRLALIEFCHLVGPSSSAVVLVYSWGFIHCFTNTVSDLMTIRLVVNMFKSDNTIPCAMSLTLKYDNQQNTVVKSSFKKILLSKRFYQQVGYLFPNRARHQICLMVAFLGWLTLGCTDRWWRFETYLHLFHFCLLICLLCVTNCVSHHFVSTLFSNRYSNTEPTD